jgi:RHS repeat-associated protein
LGAANRVWARAKLVYNIRFPGQYYQAETGLNQNVFRDYDPAVGRYVESDPIGLDGGVSTYAYADGNPIGESDATGLDPDGGPYHPPEGTTLKCTDEDGCTMLSGKMWVLMRMINSHQLWDWLNPPPRGGGRHAKEIADLWRAYARCQALHKQKCENCPPKQQQGVPVMPLPEWTPTPTPAPLRIPFEPIFVP